MYYFTSESVSPGHPDKIADQVSDVCLDYFLAKDQHARVALEAMITPKKIIIAGEIKASFTPDFQAIENKVRRLLEDIGYTSGLFNSKDVEIEFIINQQSPDIAIGVDAGSNESEGAGDQGIMFGYATDETATYMPASLYYSHRILEEIHHLIKVGTLKNLGPDAKSQVTMLYNDQNEPVSIDTVLVSILHTEDVKEQDLKRLLQPVIERILPKEMLGDTRYLFNPTGRFTIGGPESDIGLTGRKIIVDTYGGAAPHGGGAFSGKDPTKVDRSAAYMARYLAKNIVAAGLARKCLIQLSYAIGLSSPLSIYLNTYDTEVVEKNRIRDWIQNHIDLTPRGIRQTLNLARPIYQETARFGHFGREYQQKNQLFTWENTNLVQKLQADLLSTPVKTAQPTSNNQDNILLCV